jgi:hypothetical protein
LVEEKKMKRQVFGFLIVTMGMMLLGCPDPSAPPSSDKAITEFGFTSPAATGIITESTHTIAISVPFGTAVTALVPTITHGGEHEPVIGRGK